MALETPHTYNDTMIFTLSCMPGQKAECNYVDLRRLRGVLKPIINLIECTCTISTAFF